jgi:hypothetical protein
MNPVAKDIYIGDGCGYSMIWAMETLKIGEPQRTFIVAIYGAYNAHGLIGTEKNGIVILDEDEKTIVLDEHAITDSGWSGPSLKQQKEFKRILDMTPEVFEHFIASHPRSRPGTSFKLNPGLTTRKAKKFDVRAFVKFVKTNSMSYNAENKARFHKEGRQLLQIIAGKMGLNEDQYEIRSNEGGIAVSGEIYLRTPTLLVCMEVSCMGAQHGFYYRYETGHFGPRDQRTRGVMGRNRTMQWDELVNVNVVAEAFKQAAAER